jgi:hypothetical protein
MSDYLFEWDYEEIKISNKDGSPSRFGYVYGEGGRVVHTKKDSFTLIRTESVNEIGEAFQREGYPVRNFCHKSGELIGLNVSLGESASKVGDREVTANLYFPNNGSMKGYGKLVTKRLICSNKALWHTTEKKSEIRIPHKLGYEHAMKIMADSIIQFRSIFKEMELKESAMDSNVLDNQEARYFLNKWFWEKEFPRSQKPDGMDFDLFRKALVVNPDSLKAYGRYKELMKAYDKEKEYNKELGLELSGYTVFAAVTNYLTRRQEVSNSEAPVAIQDERLDAKVYTLAEELSV